MSDQKIPASVYIITLNEAHNLERALESVKSFSEIIVVDSGSEDGTQEIARNFTDQVIHQDWLGYSGQKSFAMAQCNHQWVLNLDADEELTSALKNEIQNLIKRDEVDGLDIPIVDRFLGAPVHARSNRRIRFFRKDKGHYNDVEVHESISVDGLIVPAKHPLRHYCFRTLAERTTKLNLYSSLKAEEKATKGKHANILKLILVMPVMFLKNYLLRRGFLDGQRGFINAMMTSYYAFLKEAKLYEVNCEKK